MWLDRFSGHSTPSGSPPPHQHRSYSPGPRRPTHLAARPAQRPGFSPRTSSLSVAVNANASTTSLASTSRLTNGSALKQQITPPPNVADPLDVLEKLVGSSLHRKSDYNGHSDDGTIVNKPTSLVEVIEFDGLSLHDFAQAEADEAGDVEEQYTVQPVEEYEKEKDRFEDLHRSILACNDVLKSVETSLTSFQRDLGAVSAEIETLQSRSSIMNTKLENRKTVEKLLGPAVEEISISPAVVQKISEGVIDENWVKALDEVEKRSKIIDSRFKGLETTRAVTDIKPLLQDLTSKALERIRDFFVSQIKALRSPNINAQIIQQQGFLQYKDLYVFLNRHHPQLAGEMSQAYINTMRWYYLDHFTRYRTALQKLSLYIVDKHDTLGADPPSQRAHTAQKSHDALSIGRRMEVLKGSTHSAITSYLAEEDKTPHYLETPFRNFNLALIDNASAEYSFLTDFFSPNPYHLVSQRFASIFEPTFSLGRTLTKELIESTYDCLGVLLCVRLNQHSAFELQRRKVPAADGYVNGTNMLLWPRFQVAMDAHCDSLRRVSSTISTRSAASALSLTDSSKQSTAPHQLTQRFGQFAQGILALSSEAGDDEPVASSLGRLRSEFEAFLAKLGKGIADKSKRDRFLANNYSLVLTIIGDVGGKLAGEQTEHFEELRKACGGER
ncbi:MAG: hypothetical protein LQ347_003456 [Umbilicaria vellea]|nr:MAG: hypothetical protein LQ347_003456 [Umbilicaria vellea]